MAKPGKYSKKELKDWFIRKGLDKPCKKCGGVAVAVWAKTYCNDCGHEIDHMRNCFK